MKKPQPNEYAVFYREYIDAVPGEDVLSYLEEQKTLFIDFMKSLKETHLLQKYDADKWTVAEVLGHIIDTERVMAYRILRFSRNDKTPVPGFDQNDYVKHGHFNERSLDSFITEFEGLRSGNLELARSLSEEQSTWTGEAGEKIFSVRSLVYIIAGHLNHHWSILKESYLLR